MSLILKSMLSIQDLKSLIHASPLAHRCYVTERRSVLMVVLIRELPSQILLTLVACIKAPNVTGSQTSDSEFKEFMDNYPLYECHLSENAQNVLATEIVWAARLHNVVSACITDFISFCYQDCPNSTDKRNGSQKLSPIETYRLLRAFYRFEVFVRMFSDYSNLATVHNSVSGSNYRWRCFDDIQCFFSYLSPWEAEETRCVYGYMINKYDAIISEMNQQLTASNKGRFPHWPRSIDTKRITSIPVSRSREHRTALASLGLEYFRRVAIDRTTDEGNNTITLTLRNIFADTYSHFERWIDEEEFQIIHPPPDGLFEPRPEEGSFVEFTGDEISKPNAAWISAHEHRMIYRFSEPTFEGLRKWGYVMWDKERLEQMGARLLTMGASKRERPREIR